MHQGDHHVSAPPPTLGATTFNFRRRWAQIDWRSLASVDVDRIAHEMDVKSLQQNIMNVTFCNVMSEEFHDVDPNFMKLFRLAQLIIEYLLFTQQYLSEQIAGYEERTKANQLELSDARNQLETKQKEMVAVKKENRKRRKIIEKYQQMLNAGATGLHPCSVCRKEFISAEYLQGHMARRHPDHLSLSAVPVVGVPRLVESAPRPEPARPHLIPSEENKPNSTPGIDQEEMKTQIMEQLNERLLQSEIQIKESLSAKEFKLIEEKLKDLVVERQQEQERSKVEQEEYRLSILNELHQQRQENERVQAALQSAQDELKNIKKTSRVSHLGHLEGAEEIDLTGKKAKKEVIEMRDSMQTQLDAMSSKLKKQKKSMKEKLEKLSEIHQKQLSEYAERIKLLEESCRDGIATTDKDFKENIYALQQKLGEQEQIMSAYEREINELKSATTSPQHQTQSQPQYEPQPIAFDHESLVDEVFSDEDDEDGDESYTDEPSDDEPRIFAPYKDKPYITSAFNHDPVQLKKIRQVMEVAVNDGMRKRGLGTDVSGLSDDEYRRKSQLLEQDRQTRVNTHYKFKHHRDLVARQVEEIVDQNYEPPLINLHVPHDNTRQQQRSPSDSPSRQRKKSPSNSPTRQHHQQQGSPTHSSRQQQQLQLQQQQTKSPMTTPSKQQKSPQSRSKQPASPVLLRGLTTPVSILGGKSATKPPKSPPPPSSTPLKPVRTPEAVRIASFNKKVTIGGVNSPITKKKPPVAPVKGIELNKENILTDSETSSSLELMPFLPAMTGPSLTKETKKKQQKNASPSSPLATREKTASPSPPTSSPTSPIRVGRTANKEVPPSVKPSSTIPAPPDDSPWDSDEDDDDIIVPTSKNVFSSTPIKANNKGTVGLGLDPLKRPPGGVPVMIAPRALSDGDSNESDTFTLSSENIPPPRHKEINLHDIPTIGESSSTNNKAMKTTSSAGLLPTGSSKSALTTITSTINDDFDSDISDIEVTHLT